MKIGWCAELREAALLQRLGFDFIELPLAAFGLEDRAKIDSAKTAVAAAPLPTAAFNQFFPRGLRLVGKEIDADRVRNYLAAAAEVLTPCARQGGGAGQRFFSPRPGRVRSGAGRGPIPSCPVVVRRRAERLWDPGGD